jgi:hypothetical protein
MLTTFKLLVLAALRTSARARAVPTPTRNGTVIMLVGNRLMVSTIGSGAIGTRKERGMADDDGAWKKGRWGSKIMGISRRNDHEMERGDT